MYSFIDVTEVSSDVSIPAEALKINGSYIEDEIDGYRTLSVTGREALSQELTTYTTGARDGEIMQRRRLPSRTITVQFQLIAASDTAYRTAFNKLAKILNVENAQLVFADEPDKYFVGTPSEISEIEPGKNAIVGEFSLYCPDPLKYSVALYEVTVPKGENNVSFDYGGTYPSYPTLEADFYEETEISADGETQSALTGNGDCGYVAFFDKEQNIIQMGDPDEIDSGDVAEKSQTLIDQEFLTSGAWGSAAQGLWSANSGSIFPDNAVQMGSVGMLPGSYNSEGAARYYYLSATNFGTRSGLWHGPSITRVIPEDAGGDAGATNFQISYRHKMCIGSSASSVNQYGDFQVQAIDSTGNVIAGARIVKWRSGKVGSAMFYVGGVNVGSAEVDLSHWNPMSGKDEPDIPTSWIRKTGSEIVFNMLGMRYSFYEPSLSNVEAKKITVAFGAFSDKPAMSYNGLFWLKFVKDNCDTYIDIPNKFSTNDVLIADCKNGEIYLNNIAAPELGALGNDWEKFALTPGANHIGVAYSDWVASTYAPTFKIQYREAFL